MSQHGLVPSGVNTHTHTQIHTYIQIHTNVHTQNLNTSWAVFNELFTTFADTDLFSRTDVIFYSVELVVTSALFGLYLYESFTSFTAWTSWCEARSKEPTANRGSVPSAVSLLACSWAMADVG